MIIEYIKLKYGKDFYTKNLEDMKEESQEEIKQVLSGKPMHKVLGHINMTDLKIFVKENVLIPRYETEELVLLAAKHISKNMKVLDLCTGSGYIGLAIKKITGAKVVASDISKSALNQAKENKKLNNLDIKIIESDLFKNIKGRFDVIISNPPYIPTVNQISNSVLNYEPHDALFGGKDGNDFYRKICNEYSKYLNPGGKIFFEISIDNKNYLEQKGFTIVNDINGKPRIAYK